MNLSFEAMPTELVEALRAGGPDANGQAAERQTCTLAGSPCRHCLSAIPVGAPMLVLAHRPFPAPQPYAEIGPIFLCAAACARHPSSPDLPELYRARGGAMLLRAYGRDDRIRYGTGAVTAMSELEARARDLLSDPETAYVHVRSASNNCYHFRIERRD